MSGDINVFVVDGYVGADPQISIAPEQKATRARFRIATTRKFQKESGEIVEYTEWFSVICWGVCRKTRSALCEEGGFPSNHGAGAKHPLDRSGRH